MPAKPSVIAFVALFSASALAQLDNVKVPLSDPNRPVTVHVNLLHGSISVKGGQAKEVTVSLVSKPSESKRVPKEAEGLRRIEGVSNGLQVEEKDNVVRIGTSGWRGESGELTVTVPLECTLKLSTTNGREIRVENIRGEVEAKATNGGITLTGIAGSVIANALNGTVKVVMSQVAPNKPLAFTTLNGNVDVTLPADIKAKFRIQSDHGDAFTDFDMTAAPESSQPVVEDDRKSGGRYRIRLDRSLTGAVNGGGPEFRFSTLNGSIYIRKAR